MAEKAAAGQYETYLQYQYHEVIVCGSQRGKLLVSRGQPLSLGAE